MTLDERSKAIFDELVKNPGITSGTVEKKFELTRRQLGYSINKINEWLMTKNLPVIERTRKGRFIIGQTVLTNTNEQSEKITQVLTEQQRAYMIIIILLSNDEELSLNHFVSYLKVSKNTILNDLKLAQLKADEYEVTIRYSRKWGYLLEGEELHLRKLLISVVYKLFYMNIEEDHFREITFINKEEVEKYRKLIETVENKLKLKYTDEKIATMPYILLFIIKRIEQGMRVESLPLPFKELSDTKEYHAAQEIFKDDKEIDKNERLFFTLYLLTTNMYWVDYEGEESASKLLPAIEKMVELFEKSACIYFRDREQLINKLIQHIKPAYYRIRYQLTEIINIQEDINEEINALTHLVKRSAGPLEDLTGREIPENEAAFIAMLIGGWLRRQGDSIEKKVKAIVVCSQGISVSRLMFSELKELFPNIVFLDSLSLREFQMYALDYDIVFSPTYVETDKKLFITKPFLCEEERVRLRNQVMLDLHGYFPNEISIHRIMDIIKSHASIENEQGLIEDLQGYIEQDNDQSVAYREENRSFYLNDFITQDHIKLRQSVASWEDAVRLAARPLLMEKKIEQEYIDAMIHRSKEDSYIIIGPNIAIPHAAPDEGVNEVSMSLLRLKNGVDFAGNKIHLIAVIAALDKQQHIPALMQLMKLAGSEEDRDRVIKADTSDEIYEIMTKYSKEEIK